MKARNCNDHDLLCALALVNQRYKENIWFKSFTSKRNGVDFTLSVKDSRAPGHRRGRSGRRIAAACWHVHGHFFEALLHLVPEASIRSSMLKVKIDKNGGNWQDKNIGSIAKPLLYSEACDCFGL